MSPKDDPGVLRYIHLATSGNARTACGVSGEQATVAADAVTCGNCKAVERALASIRRALDKKHSNMLARERKLVVSLLRGHHVRDKRQRALLDHMAGLIERGLHLPENHRRGRGQTVIS